MIKDEFIVGLDIGSTKVCAAVGRPDEGGQTDLLGVGLSPSRGLNRGAVVNLKEVADSISEAIKKAEESSGRKIRSVFTNIGGSHIESCVGRGTIILSDGGRQIVRRHIAKLIDCAKANSLSPDREALHIVPREYIIDGQDGVTDPVGLYGHKLELEAWIVTGLVTLTKNVIKAVNHVGIKVEAVVLGSIASALATLTEREKDRGVILVNIGGEVTDIATFANGAIREIQILSMGGRDLTEDISSHLGISIEHAEELKRRYGCAQTSLINKNERITIEAKSDSKRAVTRGRLCKIIEPKIHQILSRVEETLRNFSSAKEGVEGLVITGGVSLMDGVIEMAEGLFRLPVRMGLLRGFAARDQSFASSIYATAAGLIRYGIECRKKGGQRRARLSALLGRIITRLEDLYEEYF